MSSNKQIENLTQLLQSKDSEIRHLQATINRYRNPLEQQPTVTEDKSIVNEKWQVVKNHPVFENSILIMGEITPTNKVFGKGKLLCKFDDVRGDSFERMEADEREMYANKICNFLNSKSKQEDKSIEQMAYDALDKEDYNTKEEGKMFIKGFKANTVNAELKNQLTEQFKINVGLQDEINNLRQSHSELLEALKEAREFIHPNNVDRINQVDAAISKAEQLKQ